MHLELEPVHISIHAILKLHLTVFLTRDNAAGRSLRAFPSSESFRLPETRCIAPLALRCHCCSRASSPPVFMHAASGLQDTGRACPKPCGLGMQVMVDIHTTAEQFDALDKHVTVFLNSKPASFTGAHLTCANFAGDPLKFTLCVFWEFSHPGKGFAVLGACASLPAQACSWVSVEKTAGSSSTIDDESRAPPMVVMHRADALFQSDDFLSRCPLVQLQQGQVEVAEVFALITVR